MSKPKDAHPTMGKREYADAGGDAGTFDPASHPCYHVPPHTIALPDPRDPAAKVSVVLECQANPLWRSVSAAGRVR